MKLSIVWTLLLSFFALTVSAQTNPVKWSFDAAKTDDGQYEVIMTADVDNGWFVYSQFTDPSGPVPTTFYFDEKDGLELVGKTTESGHKKEGFDDLFGVNVIKFDGQVLFKQKIKATSAVKSVTGTLEFMCCDDERCLPPKEVEFNILLR